MEEGMQYRQQQVGAYKLELEPLLRYLPWLEKSAGTNASRQYRDPGLGQGSAMAFPVYDGTLLNFVREAARTGLMDRNYQYIYTRNHIRSHEDERRRIQEADIKEWDILRGILSRYVLGGQSKANLWNEAVQERIFYLVVVRMKEIIEYWDKPLPV